MADIPTLETERLLLRSMTFEDWPRYFDLMASKRAQYMNGPHSKSAAWGMFCHDVALWHLFGHGALMIEDKETGSCLGQVGINGGPSYMEKELGWYVYEEAEGKGYAFEAALCFRDWAFRTLGLETLVSYIEPRNERSIALAERLGAVLDPEAQRNVPEDLVFRHPKP
ncbi:GNAT family N-acetyltransferase [uncultured Cohaesibacter sp.]|uniref:GNAT family N-acetyltransferase n=1 Tax=uncultured Cohaesibacter sp. TaxID=1002546 RepID=UPI00293125B5|nr:GNAT family N-acetyltransferase [uncultured Cohaesibacter sp.]